MQSLTMMKGEFPVVDPFVPGTIPEAVYPNCIPKVFHKVWFDIGNGSDVPMKYKKYHGSLVKHHPTWPVVLWTKEMAERLIDENFPWIRARWDSLVRPIYQIDAIRYLVLYTFGGVYVDQDVEIKRPLDSMILGLEGESSPRHNVLISIKKCKVTVSNFVMAAERESKFFAYVIRRFNTKFHSIWNMKYSFYGTMFIAGPFFITLAWWSYENRASEITVLSRSSFIETTKNAFEENKADIGYGSHHSHSSWSNSKIVLCDLIRIGIFLTTIILLVAGGYLGVCKIKSRSKIKN